MRNAQDETAKNNYNLQRDSVFDPQKYRILHDAADTSGLELTANRDIYGAKIPQQAAAASLEGHQLSNAQIPANMGIYGPMYQHLTGHGAQLGAGGLSYPNLAQDENGQPVPYVASLSSIGNRYQEANTLRAQYEQARLEAQTRGQDLSYEKFLEGHTGVNGAAPVPTGGYLGIPAAKTTAPAVPTVTAAGTPSQGINLYDPNKFHNPYGVH